MEDIILTSVERFVDLHILDDDARFWLELDEIPELNPIREYKNTIIEEPYQHTVSLDLETRTKSLVDLITNSGYNNSNPRYLVKLANRLIIKCRENGRQDLEYKILESLLLL